MPPICGAGGAYEARTKEVRASSEFRDRRHGMEPASPAFFCRHMLLDLKSCCLKLLTTHSCQITAITTNISFYTTTQSAVTKINLSIALLSVFFSFRA